MRNLLERLRAQDPHDDFTEISILERERSIEPISRSRRLIILGGISIFALASLEVYSVHILSHKNDPANIVYHKDERVYSDGDAIATPIGEVSIDGWKFIFERETFQGVLNQGIDFRFSARCSNRVEHGYFQGDPARKQITLNDLIIRPEDPERSITILQSKAYYFFSQMPHLQNSDMVLELAVYRGRKTKDELHVYRYKIGPTIYTYPPQDKNDHVRLVAEREIEPDRLRPVHDIHRLFSHYREPHPFYIYDEKPCNIRGIQGNSTEFAESNFITERNFLTVDGLNNPSFPRQAEIGACHEIAHNTFELSNIFQALGKKDAEARAKDKFRKSYWALFNYSENLQNNFSIFTEKNYFGMSKYGFPSTAGHPWYSESEMFASAVCTFRYFAKEFSQKYAQINPAQQSLVRNVFSSTIDVLLSMNPDLSLLNIVFPEIRFVSRVTGIPAHPYKNAHR